MITNRPHKRALALPIVLWSIAFIAGLVVLVGGTVGDWITEEARAGRTFRARQMALTGLAFGMNPAIETGDPLLRSGTPESEGYEVKITNEAGKINPNYWIGVNDRSIFQRLFENWQVDDRMSDAALDGLTDWIDADDFRSLAGAESAEYIALGRPGFPANRPLVHIRELEAVLGFGDVLAARGDWRDLFTIWHNGKVNIQYASEPVLSALASLTPQQIQALFELRAGPDGVEGNADDVQFESVESVAALIGADGLQQTVLDAYFETSGSVRRIESTGYCNGTSHKITVFVPDGGAQQVLSWEEE
ncbi:MAG: type II secretion system protein GspK [Terrimicrobiaceae bacterium]|nr:type II secretion system protein GspK [Terrimicrobiaceae bacterium]